MSRQEKAAHDKCAAADANIRGRRKFAADCLNFTRCANLRKGEKQQPAAQFGTFNGPDGVAWPL